MIFKKYGISLPKRKNWKQLLVLLCLICFLVRFGLTYIKSDYPAEGVETIKLEYDTDLAKFLEYDNGTGCNSPYLNPLQGAMSQKAYPIIECGLPDWVKCKFSKCSLQPVILETMKDIQCIYQDIIHISDKEYVMSLPVTLKGNKEYSLRKSDHVRILCSARQKDSFRLFFWNLKSWVGHGAGFRPLAQRTSPPGRENSPNVVIIAFDSISRNKFIRILPKSYKFIQEELNATVLNKYNSVGDGTSEAIIPILTGKRYFELKESRASFTNEPFDPSVLIFEKLSADGYRTAYFEDSPYIGTFSYRFNGLAYQPTDHYLYSYCREVTKSSNNLNSFCSGDTPQFRVFLNLTDQFIQLKGKHFVLCFIGDISHENPNFIPNADEPLVDFLKGVLKRGHQQNTLIMIMGDHGSRFGPIRYTPDGSLEERLPFMAIRLPDNLRKRSPEAQLALESNADVLTTPHDIHSFLLDVIGLPQFMVDYKVQGASLPRGLSLLKPIPANRSCSEAGITPFWCTCIQWEHLNNKDPMYRRAAQALLDHINSMTLFLRSRCAVRTLTSIEWVKNGRTTRNSEGAAHGVQYQNKRFYVKMTAGPAAAVFEGLVKYSDTSNEWVVDSKEISRINPYGHEPDCISSSYPHLNFYCYCK